MCQVEGGRLATLTVTWAVTICDGDRSHIVSKQGGGIGPELLSYSNSRHHKRVTFTFFRGEFTVKVPLPLILLILEIALIEKKNLDFREKYSCWKKKSWSKKEAGDGIFTVKGKMVEENMKNFLS